MGFATTYRLSVHAVITNGQRRVLQLRQTYGDLRWGLPGGALEPGETFHEAIARECKEELGVEVEVDYLSGIYFHSEFNSHVGIFRCHLKEGEIQLSVEHSEYRYFALAELSTVQQRRVADCLEYDGRVTSRKF